MIATMHLRLHLGRSNAVGDRGRSASSLRFGTLRGCCSLASAVTVAIVMSPVSSMVRALIIVSGSVPLMRTEKVVVCPFASAGSGADGLLPVVPKLMPDTTL